LFHFFIDCKAFASSKSHLLYKTSWFDQAL
jgi:hypothetical protein